MVHSIFKVESQVYAPVAETLLVKKTLADQLATLWFALSVISIFVSFVKQLYPTVTPFPDTAHTMRKYYLEMDKSQ